MLYVGSGVSGGEEGALTGPSLMPGGSAAAWPHIKPIFQAICARTPDGEPCCDWMGEDGAGHFVKMIHNGIEYGDMQLIAETYDVMKRVLGHEQRADARCVRANGTPASSTAISSRSRATSLRTSRSEGEHVIDVILDAAGQKGTGKWTVIEALAGRHPADADRRSRVRARACQRRRKSGSRRRRSSRYDGSGFTGDRGALVDDLRQALYASKIISYAQGYQLLRAAAQTYKWNLNYGGIALVWRGGCIIRSAFLGDIKKAFDRDPGLVNLLLDPFFSDAVTSRQVGWRRAVVAAVQSGVPVPCLSSALAYFDGYRSERLPANLIQAQRDFFGAHTYERIDQPRGKFFHTNWTGHGGTTTSGSYKA